VVVKATQGIDGKYVGSVPTAFSGMAKPTIGSHILPTYTQPSAVVVDTRGPSRDVSTTAEVPRESFATPAPRATPSPAKVLVSEPIAYAAPASFMAGGIPVQVTTRLISTKSNDGAMMVPAQTTHGVLPAAAAPVFQDTIESSYSSRMAPALDGASNAEVNPEAPPPDLDAPEAAEAAEHGGESVDILRGEISRARAELEGLRHMLNDNLQQREQAERKLDDALSRLKRLQRRKLESEAQLREAHGETQRLREELVRSQHPERDGETSESVPAAQLGASLRQGSRHSSTPPSPPMQQSRSAASYASTAHWEGAEPIAREESSLPSRPAASSHAGSRDSSPLAGLGTSSRASGSSKHNRSDSVRSRPRSNFGGTRVDTMDSAWCAILREFPDYHWWVLVKEKPGLYRMGGPSGRKILCRNSHGGLQVRVGGGWMDAVAFLERYGPAEMGSSPQEDIPSQASRSVGAGSEHLLDMMETSPSMERLLVPTKSWAQKIGISTTPDLREQRRSSLAEERLL